MSVTHRHAGPESADPLIRPAARVAQVLTEPGAEVRSRRIGAQRTPRRMRRCERDLPLLTLSHRTGSDLI